MMNMRIWKVLFKETVNDRVCEIKHIGELDKEGVIDFFGLDGDDVTWYEVTEVKEKMTPINAETIKEILDWEDVVPQSIKVSFSQKDMNWVQQYRSRCKRFCLCTTQNTNLTDETGIGWKLLVDNSKMESLGSLSVEYIEQVEQVMDLYGGY
jgi:hypothetical protein